MWKGLFVFFKKKLSSCTVFWFSRRFTLHRQSKRKATMKEKQFISKGARRLHFMQANFVAGRKFYVRVPLTSETH